MFVPHSYIDIDKCMAGTSHFSILQDGFIVLKVSCTPPAHVLYLSSDPQEALVFLLSLCFCFGDEALP